MMLTKYIIIFLMIIAMIIISVYYVFKNENIYWLVNKINNVFTSYCKDPAIFNPNDFDWTKNFRLKWKDVRNEYLSYTTHHIVPNHKSINSTVASCDLNNSWKTLYLRAYGVDTKLAKYFPKTMDLINQCPCTLAFFSLLEPGAKLNPHTGIYKGVIRYHLGLIVPEQWTKCFINIDGKNLYWREGEDIMFDDMYTHYVENNTNQQRVILFLDIKRDFHNIFLNCMNSIFLRFIKSNDVLNNTITNINEYA